MINRRFVRSCDRISSNCDTLPEAASRIQHRGRGTSDDARGFSPHQRLSRDSRRRCEGRGTTDRCPRQRMGHGIHPAGPTSRACLVRGTMSRLDLRGQRDAIASAPMYNSARIYESISRKTYREPVVTGRGREGDPGFGIQYTKDDTAGPESIPASDLFLDHARWAPVTTASSLSTVSRYRRSVVTTFRARRQIQSLPPMSAHDQTLFRGWQTIFLGFSCNSRVRKIRGHGLAWPTGRTKCARRLETRSDQRLELSLC